MAPGVATPSNREAMLTPSPTITLLDDIADVDADAKLDAALRPQAGIALRSWHSAPRWRTARHRQRCGTRPARHRPCASPRAFVHGDGGIDQVGP
jgi:hypothetical protein